MSGSSRKCQGREGRVARGKSGIGSKTKNWFAVSTYIHSTVTAAVAILDGVMILRDPFSIYLFDDISLGHFTEFHFHLIYFFLDNATLSPHTFAPLPLQ